MFFEFLEYFKLRAQLDSIYLHQKHILDVKELFRFLVIRLSMQLNAPKSVQFVQCLFLDSAMNPSV